MKATLEPLAGLLYFEPPEEPPFDLILALALGLALIAGALLSAT